MTIPARIRKHLNLAALALLLAALFSVDAFAQQRSVPGKRGAATVRGSVNVRELALQQALQPVQPEEPRVMPFMSAAPRRQVPEGFVPAPAPPQPLRSETPAPLVPSPSPAASFAALGDNNTRIPPDTQGAVGPNHLMVVLNTQVRIQDRAGTTISTVSLNSFWAPVDAMDPPNAFDPKLLYDPFANRWVFVTVSDARMTDSSLLIGVSRTNDPTGTWDLFRIDADATDTVWADYPSIGFNKDWIGVTINMFTVAGDVFEREDIYAFSKAALYGNPSAATFTRFEDDGAATQVPATTFDNSLSTLFLVQHLTGNTTFMGMNVGLLEISTITGPVGSEMYTFGTALVSTPNPWSFSPPGGADFAPQMGTPTKIQANDSRLLGLVYRNSSLWACQTAFLPAGAPTRSAVQWWQFTTAGTVQQFGRVDDPMGNLFFTFPSIAVNSQNDMLLGYSSFSATQFASSSYSFRASSDPANTLRDPFLLKAGEDIYTKTFSGTRVRWGDYSNTQVDPVNDLDFWTIQEYAAPAVGDNTVPNNTRWGTWWGMISPPAGALKKRRGQVISH